LVASDANTSGANVKEVIRTALLRKVDVAPFTQVVRPPTAFHDAVTFEIAVGGLRESSAVSPMDWVNRSND
jgi:hypothetical protein